MSNISITTLQDRIEDKPATNLPDDTTIKIHVNGKDFRIKVQYEGNQPAAILISESSGRTIQINPHAANAISIT